jgi:alpha-glucoside transport system substrate-binding protein
MNAITRRGGTVIAGAALIALVLSGCAGASSGSPTVGTADGVVTIQGSLVGKDATLLEKSWAAWEKANHITIRYTGSANFDEQIGGEAQQGNAPDLGVFEQPGLIRDLEAHGYIQKLPATVAATVKSNFPADWARYTTFGGAQYGAPLLATLNGWIFYSPKQFKSLGVSVPTTWPGLINLTQTIESDTGAPAWCEGFSADSSSGATGTDWIEDLVLRQDGPKVYDEWVNHTIPFTDPRIERAFSDVASLLLDKANVNAGIGGVSSIDTATTANVATALESGKCVLTHQSSSFGTALTTKTGAPAVVSPTGDYWAFMMPGFSDGLSPVTYGGDFVAAFSNDSDTQKVQAYLASTAWANSRVSLGDATSPDINVSPGEPSTLLAQQSTVLLQQYGRVFRFDGSALMPSVVGAGTFLTGMVDWVNGTPAQKVLSTIDGSWPTN